MLAWLKTNKGLNDAIIKTAGLGYNPADIYEPRATWGLDGDGKQWTPGGLVIPFVSNGHVTRLRIRRDDTGGGPRYVIISGSQTTPLIIDKDKTANEFNLLSFVSKSDFIVVESELDGILLSQEAGDLCGIIALGTATAKPDKQTHELLKAAPIILISLDTDNAGASVSWKFWPDTYGTKARRWPTIKGKDASEAKANGLDLRAWIIAGMFGSEEKFERFCIQTIDGGLSDEAAIRLIEQAQNVQALTKNKCNAK